MNPNQLSRQVFATLPHFSLELIFSVIMYDLGIIVGCNTIFVDVVCANFSPVSSVVDCFRSEQSLTKCYDDPQI